MFIFLYEFQWKTSIFVITSTPTNWNAPIPIPRPILVLLAPMKKCEVSKPQSARLILPSQTDRSHQLCHVTCQRTCQCQVNNFNKYSHYYSRILPSHHKISRIFPHSHLPCRLSQTNFFSSSMLLDTNEKLCQVNPILHWVL